MSMIEDFVIIKNIVNSLNNIYINSKIEIVYEYKDTVSQRRNYILNSFKEINKLTNSNKFLLQKFNNNLYKNPFFELKNDNLYFIGIEKNVLLEDITKILNEKIEKFIPKNYKDFALIHDTHNSKFENSSETTIVLVRNDLTKFNTENLKSYILNKKSNFDKNNKILIIVENYKIFELEDFKSYILSSFKINIYDNEIYEVMYGSGNKVNSSKNISFLNSYKEILYFGDYDDEGFKIYNNLKSKIENTTFVIPKKYVIEEIQNKMYSEEIQNVRTNNNCFIKDRYLLDLLDLSDLTNSNSNSNFNKVYEMQQEVFINY